MLLVIQNFDLSHLRIYIYTNQLFCKIKADWMKKYG